LSLLKRLSPKRRLTGLGTSYDRSDRMGIASGSGSLLAEDYHDAVPLMALKLADFLKGI